MRSSVEQRRSVLFTNGDYTKGTEWLDDDAFPAITGWRRQHAAQVWQAVQSWALLCCMEAASDQAQNTVYWLAQSAKEP